MSYQVREPIEKDEDKARVRREVISPPPLPQRVANPRIRREHLSITREFQFEVEDKMHRATSDRRF